MQGKLCVKLGTTLFYVCVLLCFTLVATVQEPPIITWPIGFLNIPNPTQYEYGPSIITDTGVYYSFYCSPGNGVYWDEIRVTTSHDGGSWSDPQTVLTPDNSYDASSVCDPSVVKFNGVYFLYHTCINTQNPADGYKNNRICVAMADSILGPYKIYNEPVVHNVSCSPTDTNIYCVGQPAAVTYNNQVYLYFTQMYTTDLPGPNQGLVYLATSKDGVNFEWANNEQPVYSQRDVDVKYDRSSGLFFLIQGDVGDTVISYSFSKDGISFLPYTRSRGIATNPQLPSGGTNNNPGIASNPDGTFSGMTWVSYGSSYQAGWGDWHLYATGVVINPAANNCSACTSYSCDFQCEKVLGKPSYGVCDSPGGTNPAACCGCEAYPDYPDCGGCAPEGCIAACNGAGYKTGICGAPGSNNPSDCCACMN